LAQIPKSVFRSKMWPTSEGLFASALTEHNSRLIIRIAGKTESVDAPGDPAVHRLNYLGTWSGFEEH